jgi:hypothetical protein
MKIVIETDSEEVVAAIAVAIQAPRRKVHQLKIKLTFADKEVEMAEPMIRASLVGSGQEDKKQ